MSVFSDQIGLGNAALLAQCGDTIEYWPSGVEDDAVEIQAIFTVWQGQNVSEGRNSDEAWRGEIQIWADDDQGVAVPNMKGDVVVYGGKRWVVTEVLETMAGMHRLQVERGRRDVVGRGRGRR